MVFVQGVGVAAGLAWTPLMELRCSQGAEITQSNQSLRPESTEKSAECVLITYCHTSIPSTVNKRPFIYYKTDSRCITKYIMT